MEFRVHDMQSAPEASKPVLDQVRERFGFVPNLLGMLAESPAALKGYLTLAELFETETAFNPTERQVVLMTASFHNRCTYCMAAHTAVSRLQGIDPGILEALRNGEPLPSPKLEALRTFTRKVVEGRGWVEHADLEAFARAGYGARHVLEVVLGVAQKTLSNYANHIAKTPLDEAFADVEWSPPASV